MLFSHLCDQQLVDTRSGRPEECRQHIGRERRAVLRWRSRCAGTGLHVSGPGAALCRRRPRVRATSQRTRCGRQRRRPRNSDSRTTRASSTCAPRAWKPVRFCTTPTALLRHASTSSPTRRTAAGSNGRTCCTVSCTDREGSADGKSFVFFRDHPHVKWKRVLIQREQTLSSAPAPYTRPWRSNTICSRSPTVDACRPSTFRAGSGSTHRRQCSRALSSKTARTRTRCCATSWSQTRSSTRACSTTEHSPHVRPRPPSAVG